MKSKLIVVILAVFFTVLLLLITIFYPSQIKKSQKNQMLVIPPSPTITEIFIPKKPEEFSPKEVEEQAKNDQSFTEAMDKYESENPLLQLMPVLEPDFHIEYLGKGKYKVTLFGSDKNRSKIESENWWRSNNVNPSLVNITYLNGD